MRLYHFLNGKYGLEAVRTRRLKVSRLNNLNDPLEFSYFVGGTPEARSGMEYVIQDLAGRCRLLCLSEDFSNPVMWSHYADRHRGICLGFEVPEGETLWKVKYKKLHDVQRFARGLTPLSSKDVKWLYATKHESWAYERERRMFLDLSEVVCEVVCGEELFFTPFAPLMTLKEVIVGVDACKKEITRADIDTAIGDLHDVAVCRARPMQRKFGIERDPEPFV